MRGRKSAGLGLLALRAGQHKWQSELRAPRARSRRVGRAKHCGGIDRRAMQEPSMVVDPMWAGQYLLLDELWRGRERIVFDPQLNQLILAPGGDELAFDKEGRVHSLLESLLAQDSAGVWLLFENLHRVARAGVDPTLFGARALHDGPLLALRRHWEVAMVDVTRLLDAMSASLRSDPTQDTALPVEASLVDALLSSMEPDRSLVFWTHADAAEPRDSARLSALFRLFQSAPGAEPLDPQLLGMSRAPVLQAFPLGMGGQGDAPGVDVDNRLGTDYPDFRYYMAVLGPQIPAGVTLVELPSSPHDEPAPPVVVERRSPERRTLRDRLDYVEQELEASERSRLELLRDLDHATSQVAELEDELDDLRDPPGVSEVDQEREPATVQETDEVVQQALLLHASWEIEQLRSQLKELRSRPVSEIEAENASLRAALRALSSPQSVQKMMAEQGAHKTLAAHAKGMTSTEPERQARPDLSVPTQSEPAPEPRDKGVDPDKNDGIPSDGKNEVELECSGDASDASGAAHSALWNPDLAKAQLSRLQTSTPVAKDWQPELRAIASALKGLRNRVERGELKPLVLQSKLRELERGVERIMRESRSMDFARSLEKPLHDNVG